MLVVYLWMKMMKTMMSDEEFILVKYSYFKELLERDERLSQLEYDIEKVWEEEVKESLDDD